MNCSHLCLLSHTSARCVCPLGSIPRDSLSQDCVFPDSSNVVGSNDEVDVHVEAAVNTEGKSRGVIIAVVIILIMAIIVLVLLFCCNKYRKAKCDLEDGLM